MSGNYSEDLSVMPDGPVTVLARKLNPIVPMGGSGRSAWVGLLEVLVMASHDPTVRGAKSCFGSNRLGPVPFFGPSPEEGSSALAGYGVPERIRTSDLRFRKPLLYPAELRGRGRFLAHLGIFWESCLGLLSSPFSPRSASAIYSKNPRQPSQSGLPEHQPATSANALMFQTVTCPVRWRREFAEKSTTANTPASR